MTRTASRPSPAFQYSVLRPWFVTYRSGRPSLSMSPHTVVKVLPPSLKGWSSMPLFQLSLVQPKGSGPGWAAQSGSEGTSAQWQRNMMLSA